MDDKSEQFDLAQFRDSAPIGELRFYRSVDSTNNVALAAIREGAFQTPLLILTDQQTGGRGRGTNRWWSSNGSLTCSLVWSPPSELSRDQWPKVALTAGIAVCRVASRCAPACSFGLRWPNDVYTGEKKVAGILVEAPAHSHGTGCLIIGIGLNVNNSLAAAPDDVRSRATSLADLQGSPLDLTAVLLHLLAELNQVLASLLHDSQRLVQEWESLCLLTGRVVTIEQGQEQSTGVCRGIESSGALVLETQQGRQRFFGGIVKSVA